MGSLSCRGTSAHRQDSRKSPSSRDLLGLFRVMNTTILIHHRTADTFARIPHALLADDGLSWNAKGILCYLLGKPPEWKVRVTDIYNHAKDGKRAIRAGLKELREAGYAKLIAVRGGGRIREWQWQIADSPVFSPDARNEEVENEDLQNVHHSKNEGSKNDSTKKTKESKETAVPTETAACVDSPDIDATWKPSKKRKMTKEQLLAKIRPPTDYPSEDQFNDYLEAEECDNVLSTRDLYSDLCLRKWHHWKPAVARWTPIRNWKKYVVALEETMQDAKTR